MTRLIGTFTYQMTTAAAATDFMLGGVGIIQVSANAFAAGVASIPDPLVDTSRDWIWLHQFQAIGSIGLQAAGAKIPIDVRSQRRAYANETLVGVLNIGTEQGTVTLSTSLLVRVLDKLA